MSGFSLCSPAPIADIIFKKSTMPSMKRLTRLLPTIVLAGILAGLAPVRADDASHKAAADELLQVMQSQRTIDRISDQMGQLADRINPPTRRIAANPADDAALHESLRQQARDVLKEQLNWETLEPLFAKLYTDAFTEPELRQLIEFYKSPIGQKLIDKQPALATQFAQITQVRARTAMPVVLKKLRESVQKYQAEHPAPAPSVVPPGAGASPPISAVRPAPSPIIVATPSPSPTLPSPPTTPPPPAAQ